MPCTSMSRWDHLFRHEKENGFYRVSVYFISKLLCDLLPMTIIPVPLYCGITYWMIGRFNIAVYFKNIDPKLHMQVYGMMQHDSSGTFWL